MANPAKLRLAVIGVGDFYRMLVPGIDLAFETVVKVDRPDYGPEPGALRDLVASYKPDAAMVLTPNQFHAEHVAELAPLQIPVFVEKPLVTTADALQTIEDSLKINARLYCSDFYVDVWAAQLFRWFGMPTARCLGPWLSIRDESSAEWRGGKELLGEIQSVEGTLLESVGPSSSFVGREWLWNPTHGGVLWDMAYHQFAMWFAVFNEPVRVLSVERSTIPNAPPNASETYGAVEMVSSSGIKFTVRVGKYIETGDDRAFRIFGSKGSVSMDFTEPSRLVLNGNEDAPLATLEGQRLDRIASVYREWIEDGPKGPYGWDVGRQCVKLMLNIRAFG